MANIKGSTQGALRRHLAESLKGMTIVDLLLKAETVEGEPKDGYKTHSLTGRKFISITIQPK